VVSLASLHQHLAEGAPAGRGDEDSVRRQWWAALATLQDDLLDPVVGHRGVWLAMPLPALYSPVLLRHLKGWVWAPPQLAQVLPRGGPPQLQRGASPADIDPARSTGSFRRLPLRQGDGTDPLLVLITRDLQVAMALEGPREARRLLVRFDAEAVTLVLHGLDQRLQEDDPREAARLRAALQSLGPLSNDPQLALRFWPLLAGRLATMAPSVTLQPIIHQPRREANGKDPVDGELALLEALTHEVRTPLATIRTLIRSLLRRKDLPTVARHRLEQIDGECSEQIDRFGLIFLAAELQRQPGSGSPLPASELARTDLSALLHQLEDLWSRQLARRGLQLVLAISDDLPPVLSDPSRLETMLGGLMDRFSRTLRTGSRVLVRLRPAGSRLKLQLSSDDQEPREGLPVAAAAEPVGPVLSWNPSTGGLQLSQQATRRLFHRLGGRLTERGASSLTVFFPLADRHG